MIIEDTPHLAAMRAEMLAGFEAARALELVTGKNEMQRACDEIESVGRKIRRRLVRNGFERYCARPWLLDAIAPGLSMAHPALILVTIEQKARIPWGRVDMLGVLPVNLAAAALYARWLRRTMRHEQEA